MTHPAVKFLIKTITFKPYKSKEEEKSDWLLFSYAFKAVFFNLLKLIVTVCFLVVSPIIAVGLSIKNLSKAPLVRMKDDLSPMDISTNPIRILIDMLGRVLANSVITVKMTIINLSYGLLGIVTLIRAPFRSLRTHLSGGYTGYRNIWESESFQKVEDAARVVVKNTDADDVIGKQEQVEALYTFVRKVEKAVYFRRPGLDELNPSSLKFDGIYYFRDMRDKVSTLLETCDRVRKSPLTLTR